MDTVAVLLLSGIVIFTGVQVFRGFRTGLAGDTGQMICPACGTQTHPVRKVRGSLFTEIILWLCFIVPGIIYSVWRLTTKYDACPACGQGGMIPVNTPNGKRLVQHFTAPPGIHAYAKGETHDSRRT